MPRVVGFPRGLLLSVRQLGAELPFDRDTIASRLKGAGIRPRATRSGHPVYRLRDVLQALYAPSATTDPELLHAFARHAYYKGEREKMTVQDERATLVDAREFERTLEVVVRLTSAVLEKVPDALAPHASAAAIAVARSRMDQVRAQLTQLNAPSDGQAARGSE
jgi:hypothetical protein